jgi:hypothetical protein
MFAESSEMSRRKEIENELEWITKVEVSIFKYISQRCIH